MGTAPADDAVRLDAAPPTPALILRQMRESVIVTDLQGTITYWSEGAAALFGYRAEEMLGRSPAVLYPDAGEESLALDLAAILAGRPYVGEWRGRRKDGSELWVEISTTLLHDEGGAPLGFIGVARDSTARRQIEEQHRLLLAATEALVATTDPGQLPQRVAEVAVPALADWCSVGTLEADGGVVWLGMAHRDASLAASIEQHGRWVGLRTPPCAEGIFRDALRTGRTQLVEHVSDEQLRVIARGDEAYLAFLRGLGHVSLVAVPLSARGRLVGVIEYMTLGADRAFAPARLPALEDLARRAGLALETARWHDEVRQAQLAAEARARELEATFEAMTDSVIVYDRDTRIVQINSAARALFALDALPGIAALSQAERGQLLRIRDAAGRPLRPEELVPVRVLRGEVLTGERAVTLGMTALDGREVAVEASGTPLRDGTGTVIGAVVVYRDLTERRATEQALRQQAALLALAHDAIIVRAPDGTIARWNAGAEALYGWSVAEAEGRVTHALLRTRVLSTAPAPGLDAGAAGQAIDAALAAAGAWEGTLEHTRRDGAQLVVESRQALLRDEHGDPVAILEINRDLTARETFLAGVAHDLKAPLTAILGHAQLAARQLNRLALPQSAPAEAHLAQVETAVRSLARQIDEFADVTRAQRGTAVDLERQPTDLVALVRAVVAQQGGLTGHSVAMETELPAVQVLLDAPRMERVVGNLLGNAIKYSSAGSGIAVRIAPADDARGQGVEVRVQDRGVGIPAADLPRIFEPFHRASNVVGVVPGSGLGLASARAIVEQHGGTIHVESAEGAGTMVRVWLPRVSRAAPAGGDD